ncbi:MAG: hypothetical protein NCW75_08530 [Phycisphaera sp.]|nr:MAG: hypothetical protein NCW75_08530 [Phycisphaera sp.]
MELVSVVLGPILTPIRSGLIGVVLAVGLLAGPAVLAQDADPDDPAAALGIGQGEVAIDAVEFGLGDVVRPGSWTGLRLAITDRGVRQRELLVRIEVKDADGDTTEYERGLASNPGQRQEIWTYLRMPFRFRTGDRLLARVYEAEQTDTASPRAGRMVGEAYLSPRGLVSAETGMIGVVGSRTAGLTAYGDGQDKPYDTRLHEPIAVATRLNPATMPDAWAGLSQYDVFVWTQDEPVTLGAERADTLRRWVKQGGHLVVVMPQVGSTWLSGELNNPLFDIMPRVTATRDADYPTGPIRPLLTLRNDIVLPNTIVAHTFEPRADADDEDAFVVLSDPQDRAIVVRRQVGLGQVSLVGIDVGDDSLLRVGVPSAGSFWHRVLGRRGDLRPWSMRGPAGGVQLRPPDRKVRHYDHAIDAAIAQTGSPAAGVLLGFVVFITYWLIAGPVGFAVLKKTGRAKHAWVAFVGVTAVFTGIAWGGAVLLSPASIRGAHLTVIDHVYGQTEQRTRTWAGLIVPWYGQATVRVGDEDAGSTIATMSPWMSPEINATVGTFPDNRGYPVLAARPSGMSFPVRSTMKELSVQWAGPIVWGMPTPVDANGAPGVLRATPRPTGIPASQRTSEATGWLLHDLPGNLHDVVIIVNHGMYDVRPGVDPNRPIMNASAFGLNSVWPSGTMLDLAANTSYLGTYDPSLRKLLDGRGVPQLNTFSTSDDLPGDASSVSEQLVIASFINQIGAPPTSRTGAQGQYGAATRRVLHGMDMSVWMTRPCIIVLGHMGVGNAERGAPCPTPITIEGRDPNLRGRTFVRWVYPLDGQPPEILATPDPDAADEDEEGPGF